jgi:TRAP-type C4-dicarboxylate transport system permease small subunit
MEHQGLFGKALSVAEKILSFLCILSLLLLCGLVCIQVLLRYVFRAPLMGIEELLLFPTTWLYLLGAVKASQEKSQIIARVLEIFLKKERSVYILRTIASVLSTVVLVWLVYWGYDYWKYLIRMQKVSPMLFIPMIYSEALVFISLTLITFYTVIESFENYFLFRTTPADRLVKKVKA